MKECEKTLLDMYEDDAGTNRTDNQDDQADVTTILCDIRTQLETIRMLLLRMA